NDVDVERLPHRELHAAPRRCWARGVAVEREPESLGQPPELAQLRLGQRRPHACDRRLEPGLAQRDHVGVPLHDAGAVLLRDRLARRVEPIHDGALREELRLRRVDVLAAQRVVVVQAPRLEADHAAARVGEWEENPPLEVVAAPLPRAARSAELVRREALLARLPREQSASRREPEPEFPADLLTEAAAREVVARVRPGLRVPEQPLVERRRLVEQLEEAHPAAPSSVLPRRGFLVLERDAKPLGQPLDRAREVEPLGLADEAEEIAALAAAEAVVEPLARVDREARRPLVVEGAAAREVAAGFAQRRALFDDRDEVGALPNRLDARLLDPRHYSDAAYSSA